MVVARALRALSRVVGSCSTAFWLVAIAPLAGAIVASWCAVTIVHALAVAVTAAVALLVAAAGALLAADWRADVGSRAAWVEIGIAEAHWNRPANAITRGNIDPRYRLADDEALRHIIQTYCFMSQAAKVDSAEGALPTAAVTSRPDLSTRKARAASGEAWTIPATTIRLMRFQRKPVGGGRATIRERLVANANTWRAWPSVECILSPAAGQRRIATVIVLGNSHDDQARPYAGALAGGDIAGGTEPPGCRGPPQRHRSCAVEVKPGTPADLSVRDDLGDQVPVCAAELDVIESYLDQMLGELLASSSGDPGSQKA